MRWPRARIVDHALRHAGQARCTERARGHPSRHEVDEQGIAVGRDQQTAEVIDRLTPLALDGRGEGGEARPVIDEARVMLARHERTIVAPGQCIACVLGALEPREAARHDRGRLGAAVAIEILRPHQVRRLDDERAFTMEGDRARQHERVQHDLPFVHAAIAISIDQTHDAADRLALTRAVEVAHVARHLDDPQRPIGMERHGHGRHDHRLAGDELDPEALGHAHGGQRLVRRERGTVDREPLGRQRWLRLAALIALLGQRGRDHHRRRDHDRCAHEVHRPSVGRHRTQDALRSPGGDASTVRRRVADFERTLSPPSSRVDATRAPTGATSA